MTAGTGQRQGGFRAKLRQFRASKAESELFDTLLRALLPAGQASGISGEGCSGTDGAFSPRAQSRMHASPNPIAPQRTPA